MTDPFGDGFAKLRKLEQKMPPGGYPQRTAAEVRWFIEQTRLTLQAKAATGELAEPEQRFTRAEGKIQVEGVRVVEPAAEPRATWRIKRRMIRCGKANCTRCPHGPYLYVRITEPGGPVRDVSLGREPSARHIFERLGEVLDGESISELVRTIRREGV